MAVKSSTTVLDYTKTLGKKKKNKTVLPYHLETNHQLQSTKADEKLALTGYTDEPICLLQWGDPSFCRALRRKKNLVILKK